MGQKPMQSNDIQGVKNDLGITMEIQAALQLRRLQQAHLARGLLCSEFSSDGLRLKSSDLLTSVRWWAFLEQVPDLRGQAHQDEILQFLGPGEHDVHVQPPNVICHTACTTQVRDHTLVEREALRGHGRADHCMSKRQVPAGNVKWAQGCRREDAVEG